MFRDRCFQRVSKSVTIILTTITIMIIVVILMLILILMIIVMLMVVIIRIRILILILVILIMIVIIVIIMIEEAREAAAAAWEKVRRVFTPGCEKDRAVPFFDGPLEGLYLLFYGMYLQGLLPGGRGGGARGSLPAAGGI